jgi:hypothetical protein
VQFVPAAHPSIQAPLSVTSPLSQVPLNTTNNPCARSEVTVRPRQACEEHSIELSVVEVSSAPEPKPDRRDCPSAESSTERTVRDREVASSSLVAPIHKSFFDNILR